MNQDHAALGAIVARLRQVTVRQAAALALAATLGAGTVASGLAGRSELATALLGVLGVVVLAAVVQLRRRLGREVGALRVEVARLVERVEHTQRQVVSAVEEQRLLVVEQHASTQSTAVDDR